MSFSERYGYSDRDWLQKEEMDEALRNRLWNVLDMTFFWPLRDASHGPEELTNVLQLWREFFARPIDEIADGEDEIRLTIRHVYFEELDWNGVYEFIEFAVANFEDVPCGFQAEVNRQLEAERSAWRLSGDRMVPVSTEEELAAVDKATDDAAPLGGVRQHLDAAKRLLADREEPQYRNSVKESISAVEALAQLIVEDDKATLGQALKRIDAEVPIHPCLKAAFDKLWGYRSDETGIGHGSFKDSAVGTAEASFMLVASSAFVSYLIEKSSEAGIDLVDRASSGDA
jgi:hypothetical protein